MPDDRFFTAPDNLDRALEFHYRQRQHDLHGYIFAPAESTADGRIDNADLFVGQAQRMGDLFLVGIGPLPGAFDGDTSGFIKIGQPGFRLEVGMFLVGRMVFAFNDDIRPGEGCLHVALADLVPDADIGVTSFRVDARRCGFQRCRRVEDGG